MKCCLCHPVTGDPAHLCTKHAEVLFWEDLDAKVDERAVDDHEELVAWATEGRE